MRLEKKPELVVVYPDEPGKEPYSIMCHSMREYHAATFAPYYYQAQQLHVPGKTYRDRKNNLVEIAKKLQGMISDAGDLSYYDLHIISSFLFQEGKKYGLLEEFTENGLC